MPKLPAQLSLSCLVVAALVASPAALSQDSRWFKVELLVFANPTPPALPEGAASAEQWPATPDLSYPDAARFLIYPDRVEANLREHPGTGVVDEFGRQIITLPAEIPDDTQISPLTPVFEQGVGEEAIAPVEVDTAVPDAAPAPDSPAAEQESDAGPLLPTPFVVLPHSFQEFRGKAALMQRNGGYKVLFHETWVQPVAAEADSLPIVLDHSGDSGQWPPLQGSIKLFLSRYLQVETDLWLNTAGSYLPGTWQMPAPPLAPPSLIIEEPLPPLPEPEDVTIPPTGTAASAEQDLAPASPAVSPDTMSSAAAVGSAPATAGAAAVEPSPLPDGAAADIATGEMEDSAVDQVAEQVEEPEPGPIYPYRHAVLLQQTARMRSNEIHYIDHPLFGVVIKFTPVTDGELAEIAAQQAPLPDSQVP